MKISLAALGSRGDIQPFIALGTGLLKAGHAVCLAVHPRFQAEVAVLGLGFSPVRAMLREAVGRSPETCCLKKSLDPLRFLKSDPAVMGQIMTQAMEDICLACHGADLVLYNPLAMGAARIAQTMGIPAVPICLQPLARTRDFPSPLISSRLRVPSVLNRFSHAAAEKGLAYFYGKYAQFTGETGLNGSLREIIKGRTPVINAFSQVLVPRPRDWPAHHHITGFWFPDRPDRWQAPKDLIDFLAAGPAPVCVGFGSMEDFLTREVICQAVAGVLDTGRRALVLSGWSGINKVMPGTDQVHVLGQVPHSWLFPRVCAVIHHGGAGTTAAAVRAGIPSLIVPFFFDQSFWAQRLLALGAGVAPVPARSADKTVFSRRLGQLLGHRQVAAALDRLKELLSLEDGVETAVNLIHEITRTSAVVEKTAFNFGIKMR